ncbi:hypothetical protein [Carnobacterium divergens]|uniref:Divergicin A immunity protein n=1 Tax=Carnobacterium divergens TaxID=2748 RepID=Q3SAX2_CARDV|nr:hypothetical protein [Carnobacterium divergens]AAZ29032.1 divergicin A immunity protein [Carnobacterium divergens]
MKIKWYWESLIETLIFIIVLLVFFYRSSGFSLKNLVLGSLFYLIAIGLFNYKKINK